MAFMRWVQCAPRPHGDLPKGVKILGRYTDPTEAYMAHIVMGPFSINGYLTLPPDHPWLDDDTYPDSWRIPADVHGGITYREGSTIGFDTSHAGDAYHPESPCGPKLYTGTTLSSLIEANSIDNNPRVWTVNSVLWELSALFRQAQEAYRDYLSQGPQLVILCGPMTGKEKFNYPAFHQAAKDLRDAGYEVISPAETAHGQPLEPPAEFTITDYRRYMLYSLESLLTATRFDGIPSICLLPGWESSKGAQLEKQVAEAVGINVWLLKDLLPDQKKEGEEK